MPYTSLNRDRYISPLKYYYNDSDQAFFSQYNHKYQYAGRSNRLQYSNNLKSNRARTISR